MDEPSTRAMVSSASAVHAERMLIAEDLRKVFQTVIRAPEESTAGTKADGYVQLARDADFMVVLLSQISRPAVMSEIKAAIESGTHVAGFALHYPPFKTPGGQWIPTPEEQFLQSNNLWVKTVRDVNELRREVFKSLSIFLAAATNRYRFNSWGQTYEMAMNWLQHPEEVHRVALAQTTSSIFLGPRKNNQREQAFCRSLKEFTSLAKRQSTRKFVHVFDEEATYREAADKSRDYLGPLALGIRNYTTGRLYFSGLSPDFKLGAVIVVDDRVGFGISAGIGGSFVSVVNDAQVAHEIFEALSQNRRGISKEFLDLVNSVF